MYLTYDDAFAALFEKDYYRTLFDGTFKNPDGCPIRLVIHTTETEFKKSIHTILSDVVRTTHYLTANICITTL